MECEEFYKNEGLFMDGELPPQKNELMIAHLASCPSCELRIISDRGLKTLLNTRLTRFIPDVTLAAQVRMAVIHR